MHTHPTTSHLGNTLCHTFCYTSVTGVGVGHSSRHPACAAKAGQLYGKRTQSSSIQQAQARRITLPLLQSTDLTVQQYIWHRSRLANLAPTTHKTAHVAVQANLHIVKNTRMCLYTAHYHALLSAQAWDASVARCPNQHRLIGQLKGHCIVTQYCLKPTLKPFCGCQAASGCSQSMAPYNKTSCQALAQSCRPTDPPEPQKHPDHR